MNTIARDFYELGYYVDSLTPGEVEGEIAPLVTPSAGEPSVLTTLVGLRGMSFELNGGDGLIILLEDLEDAVGRAPAKETQDSLARLTTYSILRAFKRIDSPSTQSEFSIKTLGHEAAQFTDYVRDPSERAVALFSISRAITETRAAYATRSALFWDSSMYLEDAGKEAAGVEDPDIRAGILAMLSHQAARNVSMADLSGMLSEDNLGYRFTEVMNELSATLFAEALESSDDIVLGTGQTITEDVMTKLIADRLNAIHRTDDSPDIPTSETARMARSLVKRLAGVNP